MGSCLCVTEPLSTDTSVSRTAEILSRLWAPQLFLRAFSGAGAIVPVSWPSLQWAQGRHKGKQIICLSSAVFLILSDAQKCCLQFLHGAADFDKYNNRQKGWHLRLKRFLNVNLSLYCTVSLLCSSVIMINLSFSISYSDVYPFTDPERMLHAWGRLGGWVAGHLNVNIIWCVLLSFLFCGKDEQEKCLGKVLRKWEKHHVRIYLQSWCHLIWMKCYV
jgi:hypothetical protein